MNTNISGKKIKKKQKQYNTKKKPKQTPRPPKHNKTKPQENKQQFLGVGFPAQGYKLTLDHLSAPADSTAQDHTEDHAKYLEDRKEHEEQGGVAQGRLRDRKDGSHSGQDKREEW